MHVAGCDACRLVTNALDEHTVDACEPFDALLAAREDGTLGAAGENLLSRHLASCAVCRDVAASISPASDADADLAVLPSIDPSSYALGLEIARGGMGRVLAARDLRVGRPVAVKELLGSSPQLAARFEREARVTARLQHPGIVPIYEIGKWPDGTPFYTMRMVDGHTLREAIERASSPAARLGLLPAVLAAAEAVAFAHGQRVIHRDLTPSNVLLGAYGETVVIDWGLAKDLSAGTAEADDSDEAPYRSAAASVSITNAGAVIGTAAYMPPEQAHAVPVDERADVYALGAILYHVLAGTAPYQAPTSRELLRAVKTGPPPPIGQLAPHAPSDLVSIVTKAMARDPNDRYPTALELAEELSRFQTGRLVEAHAYSRAERVRRFVRRHRAALVTVALALVAIAAVGVVSISRVLRSRGETRAQVDTLLEERGRMELLAGSPMRALAYLEHAERHGANTPSLRFLLASALRDLDTVERDLDCGGADVRWFVLSPDGEDIVATCGDRGRIWKIATGEVRASLGPIADGFREVMYSHDGRTFVTWGDEGHARLWDAKTGALLRTFNHGGAINVVSYSGDDQRLVSLGKDGVAVAWTTSGEELRRIVANRNPLFGSIWGAISADGTAILTLTVFGEGKGWDIATGQILGGFDHGALVIGGELSSDGKHASTCGFDRLVKIWDAKSGTLLRTLGGHTDVPWKCVFSSDGKQLLTTGHDGRAIVWDLATGAQIANVMQGDVLTNASFSRDGRRFVSVGINGRAVVWDARSGAMLVSHDTLGGKHAKLSVDGTRLFTDSGNGTLRVWRGASGPALAGYAPPAETRVAGVLPDGATVAVEGAYGAIQLWDTRSRQAIAHPEIHGPLALGEHALAAVTSSDVVVIDPATGAVRTRIAHEGRPPPTALALGAAGLAIVDATGVEVIGFDGNTRSRVPGAIGAILDASRPRMVTWSAAGEVAVWDPSTGARLATLATSGQAARPIALGDAVVVLEGDTAEQRTTNLFDPLSGSRLALLPAGRSEPTLDGSGRFVTIVGLDQSVMIVRAADGRVLHSFFAQGLLQAQVDPEGELVAAIASHGTEVVVLDATDGRELAGWPIAHEAPHVSSTSFRDVDGEARWTPDGRRIVSRSSAVDVWDGGREIRRDQLSAVIHEQLPWRIVNGALVWVKGSITGRVVRDGSGVSGVHVVARIRKPAGGADGSLTWDVGRSQLHEASAVTDDDGHFELRELYPGEYQIGVDQAGSPKQRVYVSVEDAEVELSMP